MPTTSPIPNGRLTGQSAPMLQWVLRCGDAAITCELFATRRDYAVRVTPHWNVAASKVEQHTDVVAAFSRHAEITRALRACGWATTDHLHPGRRPCAA